MVILGACVGQSLADSGVLRDPWAVAGGKICESANGKDEAQVQLIKHVLGDATSK